MTGPVFSLHESSADLRNGFSFLKSWYNTELQTKTLHKHYLRNVKYILFEIFSYFYSETRVLKE